MSQARKLISHHRDRALFQRRLLILSFLTLLVISAISFRLFQLQILQAETYQTLSKQNSLTLIPLPPRRGLIFDRQGVLLAENIPAHSLELQPSKIDDMEATLALLKTHVQVSLEQENQFHKLRKRMPSHMKIPLKIKLSEEEIAKLAVNLHRFPGVFINAQLIRHYPQGQLFAHVIGYMGRIDAMELNRIDQSDYNGTHYIGKIGIEKYYENVLHGQVGVERAETDAAGRVIRVLDHTPAISGSNIYLTIDSELQALAFNALGERKGAVVAIDPQNGDVLAMASNPSFDPNLFVQGMSTEEYQALQKAPERPLYNRCLRGTYPLASTVKPFIALEGLDEGIVTEHTKINDPGYYELPNTSMVYRDWRAHGSVDVHRAIVISCDTYFYYLADKLGISKMSNALKQFGFGEITGLDVGEEASGVVPTPQWKRAHRGESWYKGDSIVVGIGQGLLSSTPLQLASATATLAMRGDRVQPHYLFKINTPEGETISHRPQPLPPVQFKDKKHYDTVIKAMEGVVEYGTGRRFGHGKPFRSAGKTGTAQVASIRGKSKEEIANLPDHLKDHSLFMVFAPVDNPKIAVAVIVEHSPNSAASVARRLVDHYLLERQG